MTRRKFIAVMMSFMLIVPAVCSGEIIVTSFYPIYVFALNLTDGLDDIAVRNLTAPDTGCPMIINYRPVI